jgi:cytoplasmic iron level regulating protein YaaA (DUF328/UPF0246 family)
MAYLITCSSSKKTPLQIQTSSINNLYGDEKLRKFRLELIRQYGIELDWSKTLPAYELYNGPKSKIYRKISQDNWLKPCIEIKILSALFGWIKHTDLIPKYDLKMNQRIGDMVHPPYIFWRDSLVLDQFIGENDIDLLSKNYKKTFNNSFFLASPPEDFKYSGYGDSVGYLLEKTLTNINCN